MKWDVDVTNKYFRERYINFLCSLEVTKDISMKTALHLFKENIGKAEMLTYVHYVNLSNWELEADFTLGQKDREQWKVS